MWWDRNRMRRRNSQRKKTRKRKGVYLDILLISKKNKNGKIIECYVLSFTLSVVFRMNKVLCYLNVILSS